MRSLLLLLTLSLLGGCSPDEAEFQQVVTERVNQRLQGVAQIEDWVGAETKELAADRYQITAHYKLRFWQDLSLLAAQDEDPTYQSNGQFQRNLPWMDLEARFGTPEEGELRLVEEQYVVRKTDQGWQLE